MVLAITKAHELRASLKAGRKEVAPALGRAFLRTALWLVLGHSLTLLFRQVSHTLRLKYAPKFEYLGYKNTFLEVMDRMDETIVLQLLDFLV